MELKNPAEKAEWEKESVGDSANTYSGIIVGGLFKNLGGSACHGVFQTSQLNRWLSGPIESVWSRKLSNNSPLGKELEDIHYPWLINESPWAEAFIEKDYEVCKKKGFSVRTDLPADYVASALVSTRWLTERYSGYGSWTIKRQPLHKKLLDKGVEPLWAYLLANFYAPIDGTNTRWSFVMQGGHEHLPKTLTVESLRAFVKGEYNKNTRTFAKEKGYTSIGTAWTYVGGNTLISTLAKGWYPKKVEKVDHNVFRKPNLNDGMPVVDLDFLVSLVKTLKEIVDGK